MSDTAGYADTAQTPSRDLTKAWPFRASQLILELDQDDLIDSPHPGVDLTSKYKDILQGIFHWPSARATPYAWQDMVGQGNMIGTLEAPVINSIIRESGIHWHRPEFGDSDPNNDVGAEILLTVPAGLDNGLPTKFRICVPLDQAGDVVVPEKLAAIYSRGFAMAVSAGWLINQFRTPPASFVPPDILSSSKKSLMTYPGYGNDRVKFIAAVDLLATQTPLEAYGIFQGWQASINLFNTAPPETQIAVKEAIFTRLDWNSLGVATAYTLNYMIGFYRAASFNQSSINMPPGDIDKNVLDSLSSKNVDINNKISSAENLIADLMDSFISILANTAKGTSTQKNLTDFIKGYNRGAIIAANDVFREAVWVGYGIGYRNGFRDGYSRGYRDGYKAGSRSVLGDFLKDAADIVNGIKSIADDATKIAGSIASVATIFASL